MSRVQMDSPEKIIVTLNRAMELGGHVFVLSGLKYFNLACAKALLAGLSKNKSEFVALGLGEIELGDRVCELICHALPKTNIVMFFADAVKIGKDNVRVSSAASLTRGCWV